MELVEAGHLDDAEVTAYLTQLFAPYAHTAVDAVVLGCTHYVFLKPLLRRMLPPETAILDGNAGTIRQLQRVLTDHGSLRQQGDPGHVELLTSGDPALVLPGMERLLMLP